MRTTVVIPTYWARKKEIGFVEGDSVYDHPTPVDTEGTLGRALESMKKLKNKNFKLIIPVCSTTNDIEREAEEKVEHIIKKANLDVETYLFTMDTLRKIKELVSNIRLRTCT